MSTNDKGNAVVSAATTKPGKDAKGPAGFNATLSVFDLVVYGLIFMVPIAPFSIYGGVFQESLGMPTLSFFLGAVAMFFTALSFGVMIHLFPSSGSIYTYAAKGINRGVGFIAGWFMLLQYLVAPNLMFIQAAEGLTGMVAGFPIWGWCLVFMAIVFFISMHNIKTTIIIDRIALVCELVIFFMFLGFAIHYIATAPADAGAEFTASAIIDPPNFNLGAIGSSIALCALCYVGFGSVATLTEESKDGPNGPSKAVLIIVILLGIMFCVLTFVATCVDPSGSLFKDEGGAWDMDKVNNGFYIIAATVGGQWFADLCIVGFALAIGLFTGLAAQTSVSRILYVMGNSGALPKVLGRLSSKTGTPRRATIFVTLLSLAVLFPLLALGMDTVAKIQNVGALSTYCLLNIVVIVYCWFKLKEHRLWRHLVFPILGALVTGAVLLSVGYVAAIVGIVWLIAGVAYFLVATRVMHHKIDVGDLK